MSSHAQHPIPLATTLLFWFVLCWAGPVFAIDFSLFKDTEDGAFDVSDWLASQYGFMPVPIIITEPAVGYGGGFALVFLHPDKNAPDSGGALASGKPPSISAAAGAYTENGTWFVGGGHFGSWKDDTIRYTGGLGFVNANLYFYALDKPFEFNIDGGFLMQEIKFRIKKSNIFLGAGWTYFDSNANLKQSGQSSFDFPEVGEDGYSSTTSGLGAIFYLDSRDNIFTPNSGQEIDFTITRFDKAIGGDFDYWSATLKFVSFHAVHAKFNLGFRLGGRAVDGEPPFYAYPFVQLRGVPAMRYQGKQVAELELEARWRVYKRWSLIGILGKGETWSDIPRLETEDNIVTYGAGFRYLIARKFGAHAGIDIAQGPEDTVFYLQFGNAWGR